MYGAIGAHVREQRKKSISHPTTRAHITPKKKVKVHPQPKIHATPTLAAKLPNGKSAWGGGKAAAAGGEKQKAASENHKKWVNANKNNKVEEKLQDSESDVDEEIGDLGAEGALNKTDDGLYRQTGVVNIVLYVGFGLITLGLIITFVGIGEHGFKSPELKLIGPSLIGCGVLFCALRLFFCSVPACCKSCQKNKQLDEKALLSPSRETLAEDVPTDTQTIPRTIPKEEEDDEVPNERQLASKSAHTIRSTIPNYIEDEYEDDEALGLNVEYIDEASMRQRSRGSLSGSRPTSSQSQNSTASKVPRLPDIHSNGMRSDSELVLNPSTLPGAGD